ncbi:MAG: ParB N-terminal domain-containing protein [Planctomycetes bacterium]|nr:ParB N-terminal domain-containing protein [Planctomycetota bacterium]
MASDPKTKRPASRRPRKAPRKKVAAGTVGLAVADMRATAAPAPAPVAELVPADQAYGGAVLAPYREPLGGHWVLFVALPIEQVAPTPYQRDLSEAHVKRLTDVIAKTGRFLDPIIAVRAGAALYHTPNGHHRLAALRKNGAKAIPALLVPEPEVALEILALNTEKAHNLREKSLEVVRMARALAQPEAKPEIDYALYFEEPAFVTIGLCYEARPRFSGGAYASAVRRVDAFSAAPLPAALAAREASARRLLELDYLVAAAVAQLKERGLTSPYLKSFVVARVNPLRWMQGELPGLDEAIGMMIDKARSFDVAKVSPQDLSASGGAPDEEGG